VRLIELVDYRERVSYKDVWSPSGRGLLRRGVCSKVTFISCTPPCNMPDRIGPFSYAHWACLSVTDLAGKYDIVTGEGFPHRVFLSHHLFKGCYH
jgi:hypothetical protein